MAKVPSKTLVEEANNKVKKQIFFKTLQNPEYGINYYHEQYDKKKAPTLYVNGLTKFYSKTKKPTIHNISFVVKPGQFHAFIGSNGSGKTTTIKSIVGAYSN
jgi:ABC-2 type transport system ATP-binding protein